MTTSQSSGIGETLRFAFIIVLIAAGGLATLATVAGFFGDVWWGFDLAANYRWHLMWVTLIAAILFSLTAKGIVTIVFIAASLVNGWLIAPLWTGSQPTGTGEDGVRIVQVDMSGAATDDGVVLRWLFDSAGDLIVISGITRDRAAPLVANGSPYRMLAAPLSPDLTGIVILGTDAWSVDATMTPADEPVYRVTVASGNARVDVVTTWGEMATSSEAADALDLRIAAIGEAVETAENPVVIVGNIGATRWSSGMRELRNAHDLRDAAEGSGYLSTWPVSGIAIIGGWTGLPIDVVFMGPTLTPLDLETGPDIGIEHLPVTVVVGPSLES